MKYILPALLLSAAGAWAADINDAALEIASRQPSLLAEKNRIEAELQSFKAENVLEGPEAEFEYKFAPQGEDNRWGVSVGQAFDWPGVYYSRSKANGYRAEAYTFLYRRNLLEKALEVKNAMIRLGEAAEILQTLEEAHESLERLNDYYRNALERGETTVLEAKKVQLQIFDIHQRLATAQNDYDAARIALETLAGDYDIAKLDLDEVPVPELNAFEFYQTSMAEANPDVAYNEGMSRVAKANVGVAARSSFPTIKLAYLHDFEDGMHFNGFGVSLSLPQWTNRSKMRAARAEAFAAEQTLIDSRLKASADFRIAYDEAMRLHDALANNREVFEGEEYTEYLNIALKAGRINIFTYLTEYVDYLDYKASYISLQADYARAEAWVGRYAIDK